MHTKKFLKSKKKMTDDVRPNFNLFSSQEITKNKATTSTLALVLPLIK